VEIHQHLEECGPCLREYGLEELVKKLVHKCCGQETVPSELRAKVLTRIATIRAEIETTEVLAE
jgi:mycothiol system anti-sigma-R factor